MVDKYTRLLNKEKNNIHYIEKEYNFIDKDNFIKLLGFIFKLFKLKTKKSSAFYRDRYTYYLFNNSLK